MQRFLKRKTFKNYHALIANKRAETEWGCYRRRRRAQGISRRMVHHRRVPHVAERGPRSRGQSKPTMSSSKPAPILTQRDSVSGAPTPEFSSDWNKR